MAQSKTDISNLALMHLGGALTFLTNVDTDTSKEAQLIRQVIDASRRACLRLHPWNFAIGRKFVEPVIMNVVSVAANGTNTAVTVSGTPDLAMIAGEFVQIKTTSGATPGLDGKWRVTVTEVANVFTINAPFASISGFVTLTATVWRRPASDWQYTVYAPTGLLRTLRVVDGNDWPIDYEVEGAASYSTDENAVYVKGIFDITDYTLCDTLFYQVLSLHIAWSICYALTQSEKLKLDLFQQWNSTSRKARFVDATEDPKKVLGAEDFLDARQAGIDFVRDPMT